MEIVADGHENIWSGFPAFDGLYASKFTATMCVVYINDILIFGPDNKFRQALKLLIGNNFDSKNFGNSNYVLA